MYHSECFDVIVVGGGHAGTEACAVAARMGLKTLLLTQNIETIGVMSCNPAIGGIGKSQLVKEIDALGGLMARAADKAGIHFRILNKSKGPAVWATRCQTDRNIYRKITRQLLDKQENLFIFQQNVTDLLINGEQITGVVTQCGIKFQATAVVLTTGTFLNSCIHIGLSSYEAGRAGEPASNTLAMRLRELPLQVNRLKTGTPPRIDAKSINFSQLTEQTGDIPCPVFSYLGSINDHPPQVSCWITHTNKNTHNIIRNNLERSPLYTGIIQGIGPRYCPSIEDKIHRFSSKDSHQVFLEPEGLDVREFYPNGISTSLPFDVQYNFIRTINGLESAHITRPGYAIEYDFFDPRDLTYSLQTKIIAGLFFAGQINGTTGYEEAAAQGLLAGINAGRFVRHEEPWWPKRDQAYIGVMIDDLITCGTNEPYRMFTSRSEYRLLLREDNADLRLTEIGYDLGIVDISRLNKVRHKHETIIYERQRLENIWVKPEQIRNSSLSQIIQHEKSTLAHGIRAIDLLCHASVNYTTLVEIPGIGPGLLDIDIAKQVEIQAKYNGYIQRQLIEIDNQKRQERIILPKDWDYSEVHGLSNEIKEKLLYYRPTNISQARRIPGITPAAISIILIYLKRRNLVKNNK